MSRQHFRIVVVAITFVMAGCGSAPKVHDVEGPRRLDANFETVWNATITFFATENIPIKTIEKSSGIVMAESVSCPEDWMDCGKAGLFSSFQSHTGTFNVFVTSTEEGVSNVQVTASFHCDKVNLDNESLGIVGCNSTGIFESDLLDFISSRLE